MFIENKIFRCSCLLQKLKKFGNVKLLRHYWVLTARSKKACEVLNNWWTRVKVSYGRIYKDFRNLFFPYYLHFDCIMLWFYIHSIFINKTREVYLRFHFTNEALITTDAGEVMFRLVLHNECIVFSYRENSKFYY